MAIGHVEKQFGKGSIMRMGERVDMAIESVPTGAMALDLALGVGGLPRGRIVELYGPESSGKSTLAMHVVAEGQRNGGICAYIDAEHAMDPAYAAAIGVDIDELLISQPDTGEQALEIVDMLIRSGALDVVVIDSVAALTPRAEIEGEMGDSHVGLQARLMSQALRKLTAIVNKSGAWYTYEGEQLGQGKENSKTFLSENPELMFDIDEKIRRQVGVGLGGEEPVADDALDPDDQPISLD